MVLCRKSSQDFPRTLLIAVQVRRANNTLSVGLFSTVKLDADMLLLRREHLFVILVLSAGGVP